MTDKSCQEILPILPLWLDGELDDESISVARDHVRDCRGCSHELQRRGIQCGSQSTRSWRRSSGET